MTDFSRTFSGYGVNTVSRSIAAGGISAKYRRASSSDTPASGSVATPVLELDLQPYLKGTIVEGSLLFTIGSYRYCDRGGILYHSVNRNTGAATQAGTINYATGKASITAWPAGAWSFSLEAGLVNPGTPGMSGVVGRTASRPLKSQSFSFAVTALDGSAIAATAGSGGTLVAALALGTIDAETGVYKIDFGQVSGGAWASKLVDPGTLLYNAVAYSYLPLDADQIGIDPVRLPTDGRVPIFRPGDFAVLGYTKSITATVSNGQTINATLTRLSRVRVLGANGALITSGYSTDLDNGTVTFSNVSGYSQPVTIQARIEDMARVSDVQISGEVSFTRQISHAYPVPGSYLSGALVLDDLYAHVKSVFDQQTWSSTWSDTVSGNAASGTYDKTGHPIEVTNAGAVTERWAIVFTNTTSFNVHAEHLGVIATGNTATDLAPLNPVTGQPYFTLRAAGWGLGWAAGNALRFNTVGAIAPVWIARTVQQGAATAPSDAFELLVRGDVDAP